MVDPVAILRIAEEVRREQCPANGTAAPWSVGMCQFVSQVLEQRLTAAGLTSRLVDGYYTASLAPTASGTRSPMSVAMTTWDGVWLHWWIECEGFVIDAMADRFATPDTPPVVVVPKASASAYRARLPSAERPHGAGAAFEQ